ncbi:hypothetical protein HALLA_03970 (plasmid) [Halostagnicola larsenii XH-48]|uniref:DUF7260 domain-containing protein n=1 Tax=Halostagnicola larsenii XH-48 TaxID=797299 RepID=W0JS90_9EURY|nr:hypothetical protein [Halostagnicola larsenii]AHG01561.1 hypothetical protein HALLA_03970 [Halostagnicola larsenii XH-48]
MTTTAPISEALEVAKRTRDAVSETKSAVEQFATAIDEIEPLESVPTLETPTTVGDGGLSVASTARRVVDGPNQIDRIRESFVVAFGSEDGAVNDDQLVETVERVFGPMVSKQLAPTTSDEYTAETERVLHAAVERRRTQLDAVTHAVDVETTSLTETLEAIDPIVEWLESATEPSPLTLEFETLFERHETVSAHRSECDAILSNRQDVLHGTNSFDGRIGLAHRPFVESLYEDCSVRYPVLSCITCLSEACLEYERTMRDQLTRRV